MQKLQHEYAQLVEQKKALEMRVRKSEERLRVTMESATDYVIITMDIHGNIENWNSGAERIFDYKAAEVLTSSAIPPQNPFNSTLSKVEFGPLE